MTDMVNHPPHYTSHPSGIETIEITENLSFCLGNAFKYLARYSHKGTPVTDIEKALFYINREKLRRLKQDMPTPRLADDTEELVFRWANYEENDLVGHIAMCLCAGVLDRALYFGGLLLQEVQNEYSA